MPFYFQFLTLLAFQVFLQERVDLAVIEVGIGGQYDCTNVIRKPWVCGVTSLGLDHCSLLGNTMEEVAWQKAGIFKPDVPAFTVRQTSSSMRVLQRRAQDIGCPLRVCPELDHYEASVGPVSLGLAGKHQRLNASLALQLSLSWMQHHKAEESRDVSSLTRRNGSVNSQMLPFQPSAAMLRGLQDTEWLGRNQTLRHGSVTYYLDGAHTTASMQACISWFRQERRRRELNEATGLKILLFNTTGERDSAALLRLLVPCRFDYALFCPNITETPPAPHSIGGSVQQMLARCREHQLVWKSLNATEETPLQHHHLAASSGSCSQLFPCILSALQWINRRQQLLSCQAGFPTSSRVEASGRRREVERVSVLVTGSLYLVGGVLKHLDPALDS